MSAVIKLCAAVVRQQVGRDDAEAEAWRLSALGAREEYDQLRRECVALRRVYIAANDWLTSLGAKGHRYHDGVPGELMDAVDAVDALRSGKP